MKNEDIIANAIIIIGGVLCIRYIMLPLMTITSNGIWALSQKREFNNRMKKGLKDGSIIKIDGQFYTVEQNVEEA